MYKVLINEEKKKTRWEIQLSSKKRNDVFRECSMISEPKLCDEDSGTGTINVGVC